MSPKAHLSYDAVLMLEINLAIYPHVIWIGGLILILKGGLGACSQTIIENNTEMHHTQKIGDIF